MAIPTLKLGISFNNDYRYQTTTEITDDLISFSVRRGRNHELDRIEAGTAKILLKNQHGNYWPKNDYSPYYPFVRPLRYVQLAAIIDAEEVPLFTGFVEEWLPGWLSDKGGLAPVMTLNCVDLIKSLARYKINRSPYSQEASGARAGHVLDDFGWPAMPRDINAGVYELQATDTMVNQGAMDHLNSVQDSEGGLFFIAANGAPTFQDKNARTTFPLNTPQAIFSDSPLPPSRDYLAAWFDADALTGLSDGDPVSSWPDLSGNGNNVSQSNAAYKPTYKTNQLNGKPVVKFDGQNDRLTLAAFSQALAQPTTVFLVWKIAAGTGANQHAIDGGGYSYRQAVFYDAAAGKVSSYAGTYPFQLGYGKTIPFSDYAISGAVFDDANSNSSIWDYGAGAGDLTGNAGSGALDGLTIGDWPGLTAPLNGDIAEILIYRGALSTQERQAVYEYLNDKWFGAPQAGYIIPELSYDDQYIYNDIRTQAAGGPEKSAKDETSQASYGIRVLDRFKGLLLASESDVQERANYLLGRYRETGMRVKSLKVLPQKDPDILFPCVTQFDISTRITVKLNSETNPAYLHKDYHIEGIEHDFDYRTGLWQTRWQLMDADTDLTVDAKYADYIENSGVNYGTIHDAATGTPKNYESSVLVGQDYGSSNFTVCRGGIKFDTGNIAVGTVIESAELWIYNTSDPDNWTRAFELVIVDGSDLYPGTDDERLYAADYGELKNATVSYGSIASDSIQQNSWVRIPLNANGMAAITKGGWTRFGMRTNHDISGSSPKLNGGAYWEALSFDSSIQSNTNKPKLVVKIAK